ncbi:MAG TPA: RNA polymerase sigma factor [bacterium]|nr:RNA polymerase sigma factor [bacterium]
MALTLEKTGTEVPEIAADAAAAAVERARAGDARAFRELYTRHSGRVYALCLRMLADPDAAEEATQDAFVRAWERLGSFEGRAAFSTWLHRLAVNVVLDRRRREKVRPLDRRIPDGDEAVERTGGRRVTPDAAIDLERAIAALPPGARTAFVLHDVEGYRHREIAEMTNTAEGTWKAQLHRARRLLREALRK